MMTHLPVMVGEVLEMLNIRACGVYVDATIGLGGHAAGILKHIGSEGKLVGIDRDVDALRIAKDRLQDNRVILIKGSISGLKGLLADRGINRADGVLFDFGVSMLQFRDMGRGFSFSSDEALDMRMDRSQELTAYKIVNEYPGHKISGILIEYSDERLAGKIAKAIVNARKRKKITRCSELAGIVSGVYGSRRGKLHPATKTFQALRICVNDEMNEIRRGLEDAADILNAGGRLCAVAYHSNEDRIVKNSLRGAEKDGILRIITKKPLTPSRDEVIKNPSSRSAKLRGAEKV